MMTVESKSECIHVKKKFIDIFERQVSEDRNRKICDGLYKRHYY